MYERVRPMGYRCTVGAHLAAMMLLSTAGVLAQTVSIDPYISVTETLTNNVRLGSVDTQSEQTTAISPGVRMSIQNARLKTNFDYSLSRVSYAHSTSADHNQNALNTSGSFEAIEKWAFVDFGGTISQQTISAFGTQSTSTTAINSNQTEVSNYRISPYVQGRFGNAVDYTARLGRTLTSSDGNNAGFNTASTNSTVTLRNASAFKNMGWTADMSRQQAGYSAGRSAESDAMSLGLTYTLNPHVTLSANRRRESNNYTSADPQSDISSHIGLNLSWDSLKIAVNQQSQASSSISLNWLPSDRTTLSASSGKRLFGNTHSVNGSHRTARTVWTFSDSKDTSITPSQNNAGSLGNAYDLFYSQFAAIEPDPTARAQMVTNYLQTNGILPNTTVVNNFLTSAVSLQHRQDLSMALMGVHNTIVFLVTRTENSRLDTVSQSIDSLTSANMVTQQGFSINYTNRLTPRHSLGIVLSRQNTSGDIPAQDNTLKSLNVNVSSKVGKNTSTTLGVRRVMSYNLTNPYAETALTGNLNVQF